MYFYNESLNTSKGTDRRDTELEKEGVFFRSDVAVEDAVNYASDRLLQCEEIVRTSMVEMQQLRSRYDMVLGGIDRELQTRANELLLQFNQLFSKSRYSHLATFSLDRYTDESIIVRFKYREDVRVTLNFTEPDFVDEKHTIQNVEVAYLSFLQGGKRQIKNSSLSVIVDELCKIL